MSVSTYLHTYINSASERWSELLHTVKAPRLAIKKIVGSDSPAVGFCRCRSLPARRERAWGVKTTEASKAHISLFALPFPATLPIHADDLALHCGCWGSPCMRVCVWCARDHLFLLLTALADAAPCESAAPMSLAETATATACLQLRGSDDR